LPVIGLGTYRGFDVAPSSDAYKALPAVLDALLAAGGTLMGLGIWVMTRIVKIDV